MPTVADVSAEFEAEVVEVSLEVSLYDNDTDALGSFLPNGFQNRLVAVDDVEVEERVESIVSELFTVIFSSRISPVISGKLVSKNKKKSIKSIIT